MNFGVRSSSGIELYEILNKDAATASDRVIKPFFKEAKPARAMAFNEKYFVYGNSTEGVKVFNNSNHELKYTIPRSRSHIIKFSPKGTFLIVYEIYVSSKEDGKILPNLFFYDTETGKELQSFIMKKHSEWEPFISADESFLAIQIAGDVHFYEIAGENFTKTNHKLTGKVGGFSGANSYIAVYIQGAKGSPSMARLFKYPNFDSPQPIASKSFSQSDKVEMIWNKKGNGCLILTSTDVDSTGASYYGKQALHFLATNGDAFSVPLKTEGPIHSVAWSPKSSNFIVVYGYQPAKATVFNMKCDELFDFGTGIRNSIYYNDFGNLVLFGGFGNLRGNIEVWDVNKKKQVSTSTAADTTLLEWAPSGDLYLTATTSPRLRQGNGFKIWHYSGALLFELLWPEKQELLDLTWQKYAEGVWKEPDISSKKVEGVQSVQPQSSAKKYVPPHIRAFGEEAVNSGSASAPPAQGPIPGLPPGYTSSTKQQKKPSQKRSGPKQQQTSSNSPPNQSEKPQSQSGNEDDRKKATTIRKKLKEIKALKEKQVAGEKLDKNQLKKISMEDELNKELAALKLS